MRGTLRTVIRASAVFMGLCMGLFVTDASSQQADPCLSIKTQNEINKCEADRYTKADADLNHTYKELLAHNKANLHFIEKIKSAQRAWLAFRDAHVESIYYSNDKLAAYGSAYPACKNILLAQLTIERTKQLKQMLNPEEGDVCGFAGAENASRRNTRQNCKVAAMNSGDPPVPLSQKTGHKKL